MNLFLDTSVLVRYLTGAPPEMFERARQIIDREEALRLTEGVVAETAYVLTSFYDVPRAVVVDHLIEVVQLENITTHNLDKGTVILALLLCRPSGRVSFADALLWATARSAGAAVVYSFDGRFPVEGIELRRS